MKKITYTEPNSYMPKNIRDKYFGETKEKAKKTTTKKTTTTKKKTTK